MAITELQAPAAITPVYNDMFHLVNSSNKTQDNFRYIFRVYINGVLVDRAFPVPADPVYGFGLFNAGRVVERHVTFDMNLSSVGVTACNNSFVSYQVKYGEEYGDSSSGVTRYYDMTSSTVKKAFAGSLPSLTFLDYDMNDYIMDSSGSVFMTNRPRPFRLFENQKTWLGMIDDTAGHIDRIDVRTYNSTGSLIQTVRIENSLTTTLFLKTIAGYNLNDIDASELSSGTQPIIDDNVAYYTVQVLDGTWPISELFRFNIDRLCDWDDAYTIHFQNVYGWFDSFRFNRLNTRDHDIERKTYKQSTGRFGASDFTVRKTDRATTQSYTAYTDKWTLRSTHLTEEESTWLLELVTSPQVFIEINNELIPVNVIANNYNERKRTEGEIFNLELIIEFSVKNYRQRY